MELVGLEIPLEPVLTYYRRLPFAWQRAVCAVAPMLVFCALYVDTAADSLLRTSKLIEGCFWVVGGVFALVLSKVAARDIRIINEPDTDAFITRDTLIRAITEKLAGSGRAITIVTGNSGAGKSTLLDRLVVPSLTAQGWECRRIGAYRSREEFLREMRAAFRDLNANLNDLGADQPTLHVQPAEKHRLVIFDQFEQFLQWSAEHPLENIDGQIPLAAGAASPMEWFETIVAQWTSAADGRYCVFSLRREYYSELIRLRTLFDDAFDQTVTVEPVDFRTASSDVYESVLRLRDVVSNPETEELILGELRGAGLVLALEVDRITRELAEIRREGDLNTVSTDCYRLTGGRAGLVRRYFQRVLASAPDFEAAVSVLYALSCSREARFFTITHVQRATHRDERAVQRALKTLEAGRLVVARGSEYAVAHDYYADVFEEMSTLLLDPADRDSIRFFADLVTRPGPKTDHQPDLGIATSRFAGFITAVDFAFVILLAAVALRLLGSWPSLDGSWLASAPAVDRWHIDLRYLPSAIGSVSCAAYCWQLFRNFLCRLPDHRWLSAMTGVSIVSMIFAGTLWPHAFLVLACAAGFVIGFRLKLALPPKTRGWVRQRRNMLERTTDRFFGYLSFAFVIGILVSLMRYSVRFPIGAAGAASALAPIDARFGILVEFVVAGLLSWYMYDSWKWHATASRGAMMLGIWHRMRLQAAMPSTD